MVKGRDDKQQDHIRMYVFQELNFTPLSFTKRCLLIISKLKDIYTEQLNSLALEYLYRFNSLFNQLYTLLEGI